MKYIDRPDQMCVRDENCVFYFWHIAKSGGTTMSWNFSKQFRLIKLNTCCGEKAIRKFKRKVKEYCFSKFSSFEVTGDQMRMIVETCMKLRPNSSAIVMFTFRDAVSRFVSSINHRCNQHRYRHKITTSVWRKFCDRCAYAPDTQDLFKELISGQNNLYLSASHITDMNLTNVQVLSLNTLDMRTFWRTLRDRPGFKVSALARNYAKIVFCDFGITHEVIKELRASVEVYRNLSVGRY
jgi:hypothetical protein